MQNTFVPAVKSKKKKIKLIVFIFLALAAIIASALFMKKIFSNEDTELIITPYSVERGDITTVISSTGTIEPIEQYDISSIARGDVVADYITVGQQVNEGDLLYEVDSTEAQNDIEKARISLQKQQLSYQQTVESIENLTVTAPINGTITNMYVSNGDNIQTNGKICDIVNSVTMSITVPFLIEDAQSISNGQTAYITLDTTDETIAGSVKRIATGSYSTSTGAIVADVEIIFHNPGAVKDGDVATVVVGNFACNQAGTIKYGDQITVVAKTSGEVSNLTLGAGDSVEAKEVILKLINTSSSTNARSSELSIRDAELALDNKIEALDEYMITSPITGTVIDKTAKLGDALDGNKSTMAIVADMSKVTFTMSIDELDIKNISVGQEVVVTADALPDQSFIGYISNVSIIGTTGSGVTTYPVDVIIEEYEGLLPGMNVNADIISEQATDILKIPVNTVSRGNLVLVREEYAKSIGAVKMEMPKRDRKKSDKKNETDSPSGKDKSGDISERPSGDIPEFPSGDMPKRTDALNTDVVQIIEMPNTPDGYVWIRISIGKSNEDYVEVTSVLTEGAEVFVITAKYAKEDSSSTGKGMATIANAHSSGMGNMRPGGMGGMGGMPSGGMPGGRMPSGGMSGGGMR